MFSGCNVLPDSKETNFGSSDQEASSSTGKSTGFVLVPCCTLKCVPAGNSGGVGISKIPGCHLLTDELSMRVAKITSRMGVL